MHASIEQLVALRDGQPLAVEAATHVRGCAECGQALLRLSTWQQRLRALPAFAAPEDAWTQIVQRLERPDRARRSRWLPMAGVGLVASLAAAVALVSWHSRLPMNPAATNPLSGLANTPTLTQLQAQSRYLESAVQSMNADSNQSIVNADTATTVAALEDRIALVDYAINQASTTPQPPGDLTALWRQRVDLMQSLAAVRYAQVSAVSWNQ